MLVTLPYVIVELICVVWNLFFNIDLNQGWAGGNLWLLYNTFVLLKQAFFSFFLVAEIPTWLRKMKLARFISFVEAIGSSIFWLWTLVEWLYLMYGGARRDYESPGYLMEAIFSSYNVIMHWAIMPINLAIIVKEILLESTMVNEKAKGNTYQYGLGWSQIGVALGKALDYFNPISAFNGVANKIQKHKRKRFGRR